MSDNFMDSSVVSHLGGFYILDIVNMIALNIYLQILLGTYVFSFWVYM